MICRRLISIRHLRSPLNSIEPLTSHMVSFGFFFHSPSNSSKSVEHNHFGGNDQEDSNWCDDNDWARVFFTYKVVHAAINLQYSNGALTQYRIQGTAYNIFVTSIPNESKAEKTNSMNAYKQTNRICERACSSSLLTWEISITITNVINTMSNQATILGIVL
jgi:hypothetical protein